MRLARKVAIITGGSRGIGQAIALAFAREGAKIAIVSRTQARNEVVNQILTNGGEAIAVEADVSTEEDVVSMAKQILNAVHRVDILVNNAAVVVRKPALDVTEEDWDKIMNTNLKAFFLLSAGREDFFRGDIETVNAICLRRICTDSSRYYLLAGNC